MSSAPDDTPTPLALAAGVGCYLIWGFVPLIFQAIARRGIGNWEMLAHRAVWAVPTALLLVLIARQRGALKAAVALPNLRWLLFSALLIGTNWAVFVWAVNNGQVLQSSFGYYMTPLVNLAGGILVFGERVTWPRALAIALAFLGVLVQALALGAVPVTALALAVPFGLYGIVRKRIAVDAVTGLLIECLILSVPALLYLGYLEHQGASHFGDSSRNAAWLIAVGPSTALPLALFAWAARRIPLSFMAFVQFLTPTITMFIGLAEGEPVSSLKFVAFAFIWLGMIVFTFDTWRRSRAVLSLQAS